MANDFKATKVAIGISRAHVAILLLLNLMLFFTGLARPSTSQPAMPFVLRARIPMQNVAGRMDHLGVDVKGQRLFATAFNNHTVEVIDLRTRQRVRTLSDLAEPQGALYDPSDNRLFVTSSMDGTVKIFDGMTYQLLATVKLSSDADNLRYDTRRKRVVVGYGGEKFLRGKAVRGQGDGALASLDSAGKKTDELALDAHPESFQLEKLGSRVFVNVPDHKEVEVADVARGSLLARWAVTTCTDSFPMALDEAHHRLFVACRTPALLHVFDTESGKIVASFPIVEHSDDIFYDANRGRIYLVGEGFIEAWQQKDPNHYDKVGHYATPAGARTGLFVPDWGELFVAVPAHGAEAAEILEFETK